MSGIMSVGREVMWSKGTRGPTGTDVMMNFKRLYDMSSNYNKAGLSSS